MLSKPGATSGPAPGPAEPPAPPPRSEAVPSPPGRARELFARAGLVLASVLAFLLAAEAGTRLFSPIGPSLLVLDPLIGKHYIPGFEGSVFVDEAGHEVGLRFNRDGFRGPDRPRARPAGSRRVAVVGDSMISALAVKEEATLVRRLEESLRRRRAGRPIEVLNFGVSSSSTGQELALYRRLVSAYEPDVVLLAFFVGNDFADNSRALTQAPRIYFERGADGELREAWAPSPPGALVRWLNRHSRFYVWQKQALRILRGSTRSLSSSIPPVWRVFEPPEAPELAEAWELLEALLRQFRADVEGNGSRFALVLIPSAPQVHDELWAELRAEAGDEAVRLDRDQPQRRLAGLAREAGLPFLDLTPVFRRATAGRSLDGPASPYIRGRYHLSEEGNRLAAEAVLGFLEDPARGLLASPDG